MEQNENNWQLHVRVSVQPHEWCRTVAWACKNSRFNYTWTRIVSDSVSTNRSAILYTIYNSRKKDAYAKPQPLKFKPLQVQAEVEPAKLRYIFFRAPSRHVLWQTRNNHKTQLEEECLISKWKGRKVSVKNLSLIHIWRCRRAAKCRSRWSPYH